MQPQVTPRYVSLRAREAQVFQAAGFAGTVTWSIQPHSGRIDGNGVYTAPILIPRHAHVAVTAHDGTQFHAATVALDPGWFWLHLLGVYWMVWAALLLAVLLWQWDAVCPNCKPAELLISPPLATVTASQPVRFTASAPVAWQGDVNSSGLYNAPPIQPASSNISISATAVADPKRTAGASLIWSPDIGITLEPPQAVAFGEGGDVHVTFNAVVTAAPGQQRAMDASTIVPEWLQPPIGRVFNGTYTVKSSEIKRATTIVIMANARVPGGPLRPAGAYLTLLPKSPARACLEDGTPSTVSLIALIALAGALGGLIHGASSFAIFAGNRQFKSSWTWWYVLRPVLGAAVAQVVYLVVRSGMGSGGPTLSGADCLKTPGFAGLIGMFAEPAMLKLKDIFNTIFTPRDDPRKDALNLAKALPRIDSIDPASVSAAQLPPVLTIAGVNFASGCVVKIGGRARTPRSVAATRLEVELLHADAASPGDLPICVCNTPPDSDSSNTLTLKVG
jgi:hypothetical protein